LTHYGLVNNAALIMEWFAPLWARERLEMKDTRTCLLLPFFHVGGVVGGILAPLYTGGTVVLCWPSIQ
jgi:acyl-CoA synthetase (AMP-forming)/AMP-acid ligase II